MPYIYKTISGLLSQELISRGGEVSGINSISITNISPDNGTCTIDLFLNKKTEGKFYIVKGKKLTKGKTLIIDSEVKNFDNLLRKDLSGNITSFSLNIKLTDPYGFLTPKVDVIIA